MKTSAKKICKNCIYLVNRQLYLPTERIEKTCKFDNMMWTRDIETYSCKNFNSKFK